MAEDEKLRGPALINPAKQAKNPDYVDSGKLVVDICTISERPSFLDYIAGQCLVFVLGREKDACDLATRVAGTY